MEYQNVFDGKKIDLSNFLEVEENNKKYTILGLGNFAYTEKMKYKENNLYYAIKKIIPEKLGQKKDYKREKFIAKTFHHKNLVNYYGDFDAFEKFDKYKEIFQKDKNFINDYNDREIHCLISEYIPNGNLKDYIEKQKREKIHFDEYFVINIFKELLLGLEFLHGNHIIHRDIKPDNILLDENYSPKIGDFGISTLIEDECFAHIQDSELFGGDTRVGCETYVAPEILYLKKGDKYNNKCDIYSLGLSIFELMTFQLPKKPNETFNQNYYYNDYNVYLLNLVERMIRKNPEERPSAKSAYNELIKIEKSIKNLELIGSKLSDFEEVENNEENKNFTILKEPFRNGYIEQMRSKKDNLYYVIKKYDIKETIYESEISKRFKREIQILLDVNHDNIIKFYGIFKDKENKDKFQEITKKNKINDVEIYCVVLEYIKSNLDKYIFYKNKELNSTPSENFVIKVYKQILNGLIYLKNKNVLHRGIKPSNMLLDDNNNLMISDFRLSAFSNEKNLDNQNMDKDLYFNNSIVGDPDYVSPEIKKKDKYDYSCDIYSLGLTILCLISKENPIKYNNDNSERYIDTQYINSGYHDYLKKLVIKMINDEPNSRPNANQVYNELLSIEASINNKIDVNTQIIKKNSDVGKIKCTSIIRVLQCLYNSIKENIKKIKSKIEFTSVNSPYKKENDFISLDIINLMMQINVNDIDKINKNEFINSLFNLRKKLSVKILNFTGTEEVNPKIVIKEFFQKVNSEFQNNHIFWVNPIFNNLRELKDFPRDDFPEIYEKIDEFKEFNSPFINKFYFILLDLIKCPNCNGLIDKIPNITYCLNILSNAKGKISKLINQYEDSISEGKTITISLNKDKLSYKITIDNNRRKYTSSIYDITMIEILPKDNFDYISFLNLDRGILENKSNHIYEKEPLYLIQYSRGKGLYSTGNIKNINDNIYNFGHLCTPKPGAEGSPILNLNSLEVIGVHIGEDPKLNCNKGTFINKPIEEFNLKYKKK